jgi:hypothetical protein
MDCKWLVEEHHNTSGALVSDGYIPHVRHFAKTSVPNVTRPHFIRRKIVGVETEQRHSTLKSFGHRHNGCDNVWV